jgi:hypothetical protein
LRPLQNSATEIRSCSGLVTDYPPLIERRGRLSH